MFTLTIEAFAKGDTIPSVYLRGRRYLAGAVLGWRA